MSLHRTGANPTRERAARDLCAMPVKAQLSLLCWPPKRNVSALGFRGCALCCCAAALSGFVVLVGDKANANATSSRSNAGSGGTICAAPPCSAISPEDGATITITSLRLTVGSGGNGQHPVLAATVTIKAATGTNFNAYSDVDIGLFDPSVPRPLYEPYYGWGLEGIDEGTGGFHDATTADGKPCYSLGWANPAQVSVTVRPEQTVTLPKQLCIPVDPLPGGGTQELQVRYLIIDGARFPSGRATSPGSTSSSGSSQSGTGGSSGGSGVDGWKIAAVVLGALGILLAIIALALEATVIAVILFVVGLVIALILWLISLFH